VLVRGPSSAPRVVGRWVVELSDPELPESRQPYHAAQGVARDDSPELDRLLRSVRSYTGRSIGELVGRCAASGCTPQRAGLVVGSVIDPAYIGNPHVRAHAHEGQLFRTAIQAGLEALGISYAIFLEREVFARASAELGQPEPALKQTLTEFGQTVEGSWRRDDKLAALAGWLVLRSPRR
jgi:hypothetical protein